MLLENPMFGSSNYKTNKRNPPSATVVTNASDITIVALVLFVVAVIFLVAVQAVHVRHRSNFRAFGYIL